MNDNFSETQKFRKAWLWLILLLVALCIRNGVVHGCLDYDSLQPEIGLVIISAIIILGVFLLVLLMKLETRIDKTGIYYKYIPLHREEVRIDWQNIEDAYVRKYNPIFEYGGWGMKMGLFGKGRAFNVRGNMGLQIVFKNGKHLLLGTQKAGEMKEVLNKLAEEGIGIKHTYTDRF